MSFRIITGDCRQALVEIPDSSVECVVTDPPYGLSAEPDPVAVMRDWVAGEDFHHGKGGFMGAEWDSFVPQPRAWKEALRILKPGGYALVFAGSRTQDWMAMSLRFAGFQIVDTIMWVYAQGMPKSHNIGKAIDKKLGAERVVTGRRKHPTLKKPDVRCDDAGHFHRKNGSVEEWDLTAVASDAAKQWDGWGTQLKPAYEPILVCRKPCEGTFANNVLTHGVGGLNIDGCRVPINAVADAGQLRTMNRGARDIDSNGQVWGFSKSGGDQPQVINTEGRWPANFAHDGSAEVGDLFPESAGQQGALRGHASSRPSKHAYGDMKPAADHEARHDGGSAARFFFCAKVSTQERHLGMENPGIRFAHGDMLRQAEPLNDRGNSHPTVKPIKLMRWLVRLVCPPSGTTVDMYCGSGTTGMAAIQEGFNFIGVENDPVYASIANARCAYAAQNKDPAKPKPKRKRRPVELTQGTLFD